MLHLRLASILILLVPPFIALAQEQGSNPPLETATNPDSSEAFRRQLEPVLRAYSTDDQAKRAVAIKTFSLPAPEDWFAQNFGAENSKQLLEAYTKAFAQFDLELATDFNPQNASGIARVAVTRFDARPWSVNPAPGLPAPTRPITTEAYRIKLLMRDGTIYSWVVAVVRLDDTYKYVGLGESPFWAPSRRRRITVGGNVQSAMLTHQVRPVYPDSAKRDHISGRVRLQAIIDTDGSVRQLILVSGPPSLVQAATDAVRQWRYQPTLLNGEPAEVDTFIDVIFTLSQK